MSNHAFDDKLRKLIADEHLPYKESNWDALQERLDAKSNRKRTIVLLPAFYKTAAACIIAVATGLSVYHYNTGEKHRAIALAETSQAVTTAPAPVPPTAPAVTVTAIPATGVTTRPSTIQHPKSVQHTTADVHTAIAAQSALAGTQAVAIADNTAQSPAVISQPEQKQEASIEPTRKQHQMPLIMPDDAIARQGRNINLAVNGGYAIVQSGSGLAAGMTFKNKLTHNVALETTVGYMQGNQNIPIAMPSNTRPGYTVTGMGNSGNGGGTGSVNNVTGSPVTTNYTQQQRNLPYLQLTPGVNIRLNSRISGLVGADVQRILLDNATLTSLNEQLAVESKKIPVIDPGIMLKGNFGFTPRLGCGLAYRKGVGNALNPGNNFINRDYVLVQLQYTILK